MMINQTETSAEDKQKIVLIGGMPRSGTNLVRRMIGSHSQIAIPPAEFVYFRKHVAGSDVSQILANPRLEIWNIELSSFETLRPDEAYRRILKTYADSIAKPIAGEKTPLNEFYLDLIDTWLDGYDLKFVQMVRNPLEVLSSYKKRSPLYREKIKESVYMASSVAGNWARSTAIGLARQQSLPDRHLVLQFENLTANPTKVIREICDFIDVDLEEDRMLNFVDFPDDRDNTSYPDQEIVGKQNRVYQAKRRPPDLPPTEIAEVTRQCGELAWALGYQDDGYGPRRPLPPPRVTRSSRPWARWKIQLMIRELGVKATRLIQDYLQRPDRGSTW